MASKYSNCRRVSIDHTFPNGQTYNICPASLCRYATGEPVVQSAEILKEPKVDKLHEKTLHFQDQKSDKVYKAWIEYNAGIKWYQGYYQVKAAYGRRGGTLTETNKESCSLEENALYHLGKLIAEKKAKGYKEADSPPKKQVQIMTKPLKKQSGIGPAPHKLEPKEEPLVVSGPTGRRIKEID